MQRAVDLEDDGIEAQTPPPRRATPRPDDPSEPYSPNYGAGDRRRPAAPAATEPERTIPRNPPPRFGRRLAEAIAR
ncbi:MAG: hypothetical protein NW215_06180 [Hyphomicrobiales bacterium]|nr:hypothetical protein [Hyphomicrobiales bacterium]